MHCVTLLALKRFAKLLSCSRILSSVVCGLVVLSAGAVLEAKRPNILWLVIDDIGCDLSCYGDTVIETPNIDRLAREGTLYSNAFLTAPVCSTARSSMITGMYQTTIGAGNHQSGRGERKIHLPEEVAPVPELFQAAGYFTSNGDFPKKSNGLGKNDYNFEWDQDMYDAPYYKQRKADQPFFAQLQLWGGKYRHGEKWVNEVRPKVLDELTQPEQVQLPPYYPRDPVILEDWARYLDTIRYTDQLVGQILDQLDAEGILDETIIILFGDNGISHARGKQFVYDEGIRMPLIIRGPGIEKGKVSDDLIEHIDLAATSLGLAGESVPEWMQGDDILAADYTPKEAVFAARDRCGETVDMTRSVRTKKYKYIRNFFPDRPHLQPTNYKDTKPIIIRLRELHAEGKLNALQEELLFAPERAVEELYDIEADPYETVNLAEDSKYKHVLKNMRQDLGNWMEETKDPGPETTEVYAAEMDYQIGKNKKNPKGHAAVKKNVDLYKRWARERPFTPISE